MFGKKREPCPLCTHRVEHDRDLGSLATTYCRKGGCLCRKDDVEKHEHRKSEANRAGSAGAAAGPPLPTNNALYIGAISPTTSNLASSSAYARQISIQQAFLQQQLMKMAIPPGVGMPLEQQLVKQDEWAGEVYRGWRAFRLWPDPARGVFRLAAIAHKYVWETGRQTAKCMANEIHQPKMPEHMEHCACGIYLFNDKRTAMQQMFAEGAEFVVGELAGWGTVIEHTDGYRVSEARIEGLWTLTGSPELCETLAQVYDVPVRNLWEALALV